MRIAARQTVDRPLPTRDKAHSQEQMARISPTKIFTHLVVIHRPSRVRISLQSFQYILKLLLCPLKTCLRHSSSSKPSLSSTREVSGFNRLTQPGPWTRREWEASNKPSKTAGFLSNSPSSPPICWATKTSLGLIARIKSTKSLATKRMASIGTNRMPRHALFTNSRRSHPKALLKLPKLRDNH